MTKTTSSTTAQTRRSRVVKSAIAKKPEVIVRPLRSDEAAFLDRLEKEEDVLSTLARQRRLDICTSFPGIQKLLDAAVTERRAEDSQRLQELLLEYARLLEDNKYLASEVVRSSMNVEALKNEPESFRRRVLFNARIRTFNEIRLDASRNSCMMLFC
jgi:hypothetical protein